MKVITKKPGEVPEATEIKDNLDTLQEFVGGRIEIVRMPEHPDIAIILNEEGKLKNLEPNFNYYDDVIVGNVIFAGIDGEDLVDLTQEQAMCVYFYLLREGGGGYVW